MTLVHSAVDVDAPPDVVWKVVADPRNLPYWDRHIAKVQDVPDDGLKEGVEYSTEVRLAGAHARIDATVEEMREHEYSRIRLSGPLDAVVTTRLFPIENGRTRLEHDVDYRFRGPLGQLVARALQITGGPSLVLKRGTLAQKRQVEEGG